MAAIAAAAVSVSALGAGAVLAAEEAAKNPAHDLVAAIATRFNLEESEVQEVFDAHRKEMEVEHEAKRAEHLAKAVEDDKLTQAQADAITAKMDEVKTFMESLKEMPEDERKEAMRTQREAMKAWVEENEIPKEFMRFGKGMHGRGPGGPGMMQGEEGGMRK